MKVNEFEEKLRTVSDSKLRRMLAEVREKGPEVALNLLTAEARRRGIDPDEASSASPASPAPVRSGVPSEGFFPDSGPKYVPRENRISASAEEALPEALASDPDAPANAGAWLHEEANQGMPVVAKVLIAVVVIGGALGGLFYILNKGG